MVTAHDMRYQQFATLSRSSDGSTVTFRDDSKGKIIGIGNIKIGSFPLIENVVLVKGLKHNLLSISQFCDKSLRVIFYDSTCDVVDKKNNSCVLFSFRENNICIIDILNLDFLLLVYPQLMRFMVMT